MKAQRYSLPARLIHWTMAVGVAFMWACGFVMTTLVADDSPLEEALYDLHISVGVTLLALLAVRVAVRFANPPPPLPDAIHGVERLGAHLGHAALYVLPAAAMALGWVEVDLGGHGVAWFGIELPSLLAEADDAAGELAETLHKWVAYSMLGVAVVHVAAVAKHRWIDENDVLHRMTLGRRGAE